MQIKITGLDDLKKALSNFSDRRLESAIAEALNRTGKAVQADWKQEIASALEGATSALSRNAPIIKQRADVGKLQAAVGLRDQITGGGVPPSVFLATLERGGVRGAKKYEGALQAAGILPRGMVTVPGGGAQLDQYGSVSRAQIAQVLRDLKVQASGAYARTAKRARRDAGTYFAVPRGHGKLPPGIYARVGRDVKAVLLFQSAAQYRRTLDLEQRGLKVAQRELPKQMQAAIAKRIASLAARKT